MQSLTEPIYVSLAQRLELARADPQGTRSGVAEGNKRGVLIDEARLARAIGRSSRNV
jgi:hypothetical protein